jgi:hypothetical protein
MTAKLSFPFVVLAGAIYYLHGLAEFWPADRGPEAVTSFLGVLEFALFVGAVGWFAVHNRSDRWYFSAVLNVGVAYYGGGVILPLITIALLHGSVAAIAAGAIAALITGLFTLPFFLGGVGVIGAVARLGAEHVRRRSTREAPGSEPVPVRQSLS